MSSYDKKQGRPKVESLDQRTTQEWRALTAQTVLANTIAEPTSANAKLAAAADAEPQSPVAPAYRLWMGDNLARETRYLEALEAFDSAIDCAQSAQPFHPRLDPIRSALVHKAQSATLGGEPKTAITTYRDLAARSPDAADPLFHAGLVAERNGDDEEAAELYRSAGRREPRSKSDDPSELARRALKRLEDPETNYSPKAQTLADLVRRAFASRDTHQLDTLITKTHFAVGVVGGHTIFEDQELLQEFYRDLLDSTISAQQKLLGSGNKRYLLTTGWNGEWFRGDVTCLLTQAPKGWQWTGVAISQAHKLWLDRWRPRLKATNQPLPFALRAPWPVGQSFRAGGFIEYGVKQAAILAAPGKVKLLLTLGFAANRCGFGPAGFYYNDVFSHNEEDAFAIDFTRYKRNRPYDNESGGTPVLAARGGIVANVRAGVESGDDSDENFVDIIHSDPDNPADIDRFRSRYLHLEGPMRIPVSAMMPVITGQRLGNMNDTGQSVVDHLHFSIHDRNIPHPNVSYGQSVRPSPLDGVRIGDGDSGTCVRSNNVERTPGLNISPMSISFGSVPFGDIRTRALRIENSLGSPTTVSFPASPAGPFKWSSFNQTIDDGQTEIVSIEFIPVDESLSQETLTITSTAPGSPHTISVSGRGKGGVEPL